MGGSKIKLTGEEFEHSLALTISEIKEKVRKKKGRSHRERKASEVIAAAYID